MAFREVVWRPDGQLLAVSAVEPKAGPGNGPPTGNFKPFVACEVMEFPFDAERMELGQAVRTMSGRFAPVFSPDGLLLVTQGNPYQPGSSLLVTTRNGTSRKVVAGFEVHRPTLSSNGRLLFHGCRVERTKPEEPFGLWITDLEGQEPKAILQSAYGSTSSMGPVASWSPDGTRIATKVAPTTRPLSPHDISAKIAVVDVESGQTTEVQDKGFVLPLNECVRWSPEGNAIAYTCTDSQGSASYPTSNLCIANSDGSHVRRLADGIFRILDWR